MIKLITVRAIGREAFFLQSDVRHGKQIVGSVRAHHAGSGWAGHLSEYFFTPNEAGVALGLREAHGRKLRETLAKAQPIT